MITTDLTLALILALAIVALAIGDISSSYGGLGGACVRFDSNEHLPLGHPGALGTGLGFRGTGAGRVAGTLGVYWVR